MKKFTKIVSLILALVLVIGASAMPAMAASTCRATSSTNKCPDCGISKDYTEGKKNGSVLVMSWAHGCTKGPYIFLTEDYRATAQKNVANGKYTVMYYMDANGDLYTDMPKYGGTLVGKNGSAEKDAAMYGTTKQTQKTMWEIYNSFHTSDYMGHKADTTSFGFSDVPANAWYADAVNALANSGIVNGVGNNKFNPNGAITWKEMYWLLERLLGVNGEYLPNGTDYYEPHQVAAAIMGWAYNTIPANDATPVNRAEAVSIIATLYSLAADNRDSMYAYSDTYCTNDGIATGAAWANGAAAYDAAKAIENGAKGWTLADIPDGKALIKLVNGDDTGYNAYAKETVLDQVKFTGNVINVANILRAYTLGLVNGTDSKGTLNPTGTLTRAEFCQLLYNAGIFGFIQPIFTTTSNVDNSGPVRFMNSVANGGAAMTGVMNYMKTHTPDGTKVG